MKRVVFMFPGQGSQTIGMGQDIYEEFPEVKAMFEKANQVLDKDITELMFSGPKEALTLTENAQPALLLTSIALNSLLEKNGIKPIMTVGHSLGEYSALVASGSLTLEEALPLVATRGRLMEEAFPKGQGSMAAVLGLTEEKVTSALAEAIDTEIVDIANLNCPGQIVISGTKEGLEQVEPILKDAGARRIIHLNVSGPFHSQLMKPASEKFAKELKNIIIQDAKIPVYANVTADAVIDHQEIQALLVQQLYSPVRFEASVRNMMDDNVDAFVEVGTGKVLSGLIKKIDRKMKVFTVQDAASLDKFIDWYKGE